MSDSSLPLDGQTAIVTGSSRNIGRAIALVLAADGACVVINARNDEEGADAVVAEIETAGGRAIKHMADVTDEVAVDGLAQAAIDAFGGISILVNNAAVRRQQSLESMSLAEWRAVIAVILDAAFLCARACLPHMVSGGGGAIVNFTSTYGNGVNQENMVNSCAVQYCAAKGAVRSFTVALARDLAPRIRVNAVAPGPIEANWEADWGIPAAHIEEAIAMTPLKRMGKPDEIAETVLFLASDGAGYITGQMLYVDGGWTFDG